MKKLLFFVSLILYINTFASYDSTIINNKNALIYLPDNYNANEAGDVMIFYPGFGEADGVLKHLYNQGLPLQIKAGAKFPFVIICIQPAYAYFQNAEATNNDINYVVAHFKTARIYLSGLSAGGWAIQNYMSKSLDYAKRISGIVVMSAQPDYTVGSKFQYSENYSNIKNAGVKYWCIMGENDGFYNAQKKITDSIGGLWTVIANAAHSDKVWTPGYDPKSKFAEADYKSIYEWLQQGAVEDTTGTGSDTTIQQNDTSKVITDTTSQQHNDSINHQILIPVQSNGQVYLLNKNIGATPGDTLLIPTTIPLQSVYLWGLHGSAEKHIVVKFFPPLSTGDGSGGEASVGGYKGYAFILNDCQYIDFPQKIIIDGKDTAVSGNGLTIGTKCHDIYFYSASISNTAAGVQVKWEPIEGNDSTYYPIASIKNIYFRRLYIHNTKGEGAYIGHSGTMSAAEIAAGKIPPQIVGFRIDTLIVDGTNWDAAQFSNTQALQLGYISISNYGRSNKLTQRDGFLSGGNVTLAKPVDKINVFNGTGAGIKIFSRGVFNINNATLINTGLTPGEHAVYVDDRPSNIGLPPLQLMFDKFVIDSTAGNAMVITNYRKTQVPGSISNVNYIHAKPISDNAGDTLTNIKLNDVTTLPDDGKKIIRSFKYKKRIINVIIDAEGNLSASYLN